MKTGVMRAGIVLAGSALIGLLSGCPNPIVDQVAEDVLVEQAGGRPQVVSRTPAPDSSGVPLDAEFTVEFNMDLDVSSLTAGVRIYPEENPGAAVDGVVTYNEDTRVAAFVPSARLERETAYRISLSDAIRNAGGASLGNEVSWGFTTTGVNSDEIRIDLTAALTPTVSDTAPLWLATSPFPIDPSKIEQFGPYSSGNRTIVLNRSDLTDSATQEEFVLILFHDQDNDRTTNDPSWIYLDKTNGNAVPDLYNGISEFNAANTSVEANPDIAVGLGERVAIDLTASAADDDADHISTPRSIDPAGFLDGPFTDLNAALSSAQVFEAESQYFIEWFAFTVPSGGTDYYTIQTSSAGPVNVFHSLRLYRYDPDSATGGSVYMGGGSSNFGSGIAFATLNTEDTSDMSAGTTAQLNAGETYYLSILTFWIEAFDTPVESGNYEISITRNNP